jgi:hypothetical protein
MSSIAAGSMSLITLTLDARFPPFDDEPPMFMRTPSTTKIGLLFSEIEFSPRMRICGEPLVNAPGMTTMPATFPTSKSLMLVIDVCSTRADTSPSVATALPSSILRCCPVAVVTTSASLTTAVVSSKSTVDRAACRHRHGLLERLIADAQRLHLDGTRAQRRAWCTCHPGRCCRGIGAERQHAHVGQWLATALRRHATGDRSLPPRGGADEAHRA